MIAASAPPWAHAELSALHLRILSAAVLAPIALGAAWFGAPFLPLLVLAAGVAMGWEWAMLCGHERIDPQGYAVILGIFASIALCGLGHPLGGSLLAFVGSGAAVWLARRRHDTETWLTAIGVLWVALPLGALVWLSANEAYGRAVIFWILGIVWATDTGAYVVGRQVGGPKLAPRFSPSKTWSGLLGGMVSAAIAGPVIVLLFGGSLNWPLVLASGALAGVAQCGDLAESVVKRHYGVKDASSLIPGHGGLLDRLDGMLAVIPVVSILSLLFGSVTHW